MQTKGFIRVLTIALLLICAFYLSFTFVSSHYQNVAEKKALAAAGITSADTSNEKYKTALNEYLDSLANDPSAVRFTGISSLPTTTIAPQRPML